MTKQEAIRHVWSYLYGHLSASSEDEVFGNYDEMTTADQQRAQEAVINVASRLARLAE